MEMINLAAIGELTTAMNEAGAEITALYDWAVKMRPDGMFSDGSKMTKARLNDLRRKLQSLKSLLPDAIAVVRDLRDSGHFNRAAQPLKLVPR